MATQQPDDPPHTPASSFVGAFEASVAAVGAATLYTWLSDDATEQRSLTYAALRRQATVAQRSSTRFRLTLSVPTACTWAPPACLTRPPCASAR